MKRRTIGSWFVGVIPCTLALALAAEPARAGWDASGIDGHVDMSTLAALADEHPEISVVEVTIPRSLLGAISRAEGEGEAGEEGEGILGLEWASAIILEIEDPVVQEKARAFFNDTESRLAKEGWERLARIREESARVNVFVLNGGEKIRGVVVMVAEDGAYIFTNLAGQIDPELLGELSEDMGVPGLDRIPEVE